MNNHITLSPPHGPYPCGHHGITSFYLNTISIPPNGRKEGVATAGVRQSYTFDMGFPRILVAETHAAVCTEICFIVVRLSTGALRHALSVI